MLRTDAHALNRQRAITVVIPSLRDRDGAMATARALASQALPSGSRARVVVVSQAWPPGDGRLDGPADVDVVRVPHPIGRAVARNLGAARAGSDLLVFVDADCRPRDASYLSNLADVFDDPDVVAAGGPVLGEAGGFWTRYQAEVDHRRARRARDGAPVLTAANLAVRRDAFAACGGFDEAFVGYGFEDRDLVLRLATLGKVVRAPGAVVHHRATLELADVAAKLCEAGATTSLRFSRMHPEEYRASGYASIDARLHPWLRLPGRVLGAMALRAARPLGTIAERPWMPYAIARALVRGTSAAAFLHGTARRQPDSNAA